MQNLASAGNSVLHDGHFGVTGIAGLAGQDSFVQTPVVSFNGFPHVVQNFAIISSITFPTTKLM